MTTKRFTISEAGQTWPGTIEAPSAEAALEAALEDVLDSTDAYTPGIVEIDVLDDSGIVASGTVEVPAA